MVSCGYIVITADPITRDTEASFTISVYTGIIKESGNNAGGTEDDLFSDVVTEFSDSGISVGATKLLDSPIEVGKAYDNLEVCRRNVG
ncbi:hypothetical protein L6452_31162 [Arctium lappa]|uniref:Uncharacterized protein n=1 Tax=Arctium lappa TaxID=4217 RepID=A0ACB8ZKH0_ARCLA|nr:hypothetical protein L6452_31162 [Arctium lappa]